MLLGMVSTVAGAMSPLLKTPEQLAYLANRGPVTLCIHPDLMPYEKIDRQGRHIGITADYVELFSGMIQQPFQIIPTMSRVQSEQYAAQRKCDVISLLNDSSAGNAYLNFTSTYLEASVVLIAQQGPLFLDGLTHISGKSLALEKGYEFEDLIIRDYPQIKLVYVNSLDEALALVASGDVYATLGNLYVATTLLQKLGLTNLKVAGTTEFKNTLHFGVRNDDTVLLALLQAAIDQLDPIEENKILQQWMSLRIDTPSDYRQLIQVLLTALLVVGLLLYRQWSIRQLTDQLKHANQQLKIKSEALNHLSRTDSLTKLHNRLHLDEHLAIERQRYERYETPFCCVLMEIDNFNDVNDLYGHSVGDTILQDVAGLLKTSVRFNDLVGRWGVEQFIILCPQTLREGALTLADTLRLKIEQHQFESVPNLTCSFGVAQGKKNQTDDQLMNNADEALFRAKAQRKNRVCSALD